MSLVKKRRLCIIALVAAVCVSIGTVLMIRANQTVEPKTVYLLPEPNPERAEMLKRAMQPTSLVYAPSGSESAQVQDRPEERSESFNSELSSHDAEFNDAEFESYLLGLEDDIAEEKRDFPPVPGGFPSDLTPVWLTLPGYQKGDMPEHESIYRVLIKLWNQGERGFINGAFRDNDGKVYPLYPDVVYVKWGYGETHDERGNPTPYRYIATSMGTHARDFNFTTEDFVTGDWETMYPGTKFVAYDDAGYDPYTFLTDDD
ncbi:MAG: hypothetical protein OXN17_20120 [Candidatus Poribacteria bacterium]|nr:hypothetical protein [Candidatus Poribacteria bacterium]MDE0502519.1 hypothetical protein [Candidatus Poribacteria bacterium]